MADAPYKSAEGKDLRERGRRWIARIEAAGVAEKNWFNDADRACRVYSGEGTRDYGNDTSIAGTYAYDFNILYANVETIVPAVINSPPSPDIRRRYGDADPVAKDVAEIIERSIRVQVDDSRMQTELEATAQDGFLAGRGVIRLRFVADVEGDGDELQELAEKSHDDDNGGESAESDPGYDDEPDNETEVEGSEPPDDDPALTDSKSVSNERIVFEAVSWRDYRHGPSKRWPDRPWDAFRHAIPMEDLEGFADNAMMDAQTLPEDKLASGDSDNDVVVWEVWCKKDRTVYFIEHDTGRILKKVKDPLEWSGFFPIATPVQPIELNGRLMPINPFSIYMKLADELDITTRRIAALTRQMKVAGWYPGSATDLQNMLDASDNDFVPIADAEIWAQNGGLQNAVAFWPIEKFIVALRELYANREQTKQAIYEITGISDIVRGASKATETLGAQEIKSQWGSLRIQKFQRMLIRAARDLFVMMSEIIPAKFSDETLQQMTGIQIIPTEQDKTPLPPPQQPMVAPNTQPGQLQQMKAQFDQQMGEYQKAEQERQAKLEKLNAVKELLKKPLQMFYRIDVESDSTVRADLTRQKQEVAEFLKGAGAYWNAIGPLVQQGTIPMEAAAEIFASNARMFNLGKSVEDTIDSMILKAKEVAKQPKPPNPEQIAAEADAKAKEADGQAKVVQAQADQQRAATEAQQAQQEGQTKQIENAERQQALQAKAANDAFEFQRKQDASRIELDGKARINEQTLALSAEKHAQDMDIGRLQIEKLNTEIGAIGVKALAATATATHNANLGERAQTLKESQAKEPKK